MLLNPSWANEKRDGALSAVFHSDEPMDPRIYRLYVIASLLLVAVVFGGAACSQTAQSTGTPLVLGLDHIPVAVTDLDGAAEQYRKLGFALKPGMTHENGIRNQHVKFPDGTEIELISAREVRDPLTAEYLRHLVSGDGAAFVGFYAPDMDRLAGWLDAEGRTYRRDSGLLAFPESDVLRYIFFGNRLRSTTDQPEHFRHLNGAEALIGVWIAGEDLTSERQLFTALGASIIQQEIHFPESIKATVAKLQQGAVVFLPGSQQLVPGRRIVGATVRTRDLDALRRVMTAASWSVPPVVLTTNGRSIFVPPSIAHGIWLEFRQDAGD